MGDYRKGVTTYSTLSNWTTPSAATAETAPFGHAKGEEVVATGDENGQQANLWLQCYGPLDAGERWGRNSTSTSEFHALLARPHDNRCDQPCAWTSGRANRRNGYARQIPWYL